MRIDQAIQSTARVGARCGARLEGGGAEERQERLVLALHGRGFVTGLAQEAAGEQDAHDPAAGIPLHALDFTIVERQCGVEHGHGGRAVGHIDTIQQQGMEMNIQGERGPEALQEIHRSRVSEAAREEQALGARAAPVRGEEIPLGADMDGAPLSQIVEPQWLAAHPPRSVPTHDTPEWLRAQASFRAESRGLEERLEQLRALGYNR